MSTTYPEPSKEVVAKAISSAVVADFKRYPSIGRLISRARMSPNALRNIMFRDIERDVKRAPGRPLFPSLRKVFRTQMRVEGAKLRGGLSQWADLAGAIAGAASGIVGAKITAEGNKDLAKVQLKQEALALQAAQLQADAARLNLAAAQGAPSAATSSGAAKYMIPAVIGAGVLVAGGAAYMMMRR